MGEEKTKKQREKHTKKKRGERWRCCFRLGAYVFEFGANRKERERERAYNNLQIPIPP